MGEYDCDAIQVLKGLEGVRKRPGMYIGDTSTGDGLRNMIFELVGHVVDQFDAREATEVAVDITPDAWVTVRDDGLGLPPQVLEQLLTRLHGGRRFDHQSSYALLHGVGSSVINALSARLELETTYQGVRWAQAFERGEPVTSVRRLGPTAIEGTRVRFRPDPTIFASIAFDCADIEARLRDLAWLKPHLRVFFQERRLHGRGGTLGLARELVSSRGDAVEMSHVIERRGSHGWVDVGLAWSSTGAPLVRSFAMSRATRLGGVHVEGFWEGLAAYARGRGSAARTVSAVRELLGTGLAAVVHVELADPKYDSFERARLGNPHLVGVVRNAVGGALKALPSYSSVRKYLDARLGVAS